MLCRAVMIGLLLALATPVAGGSSLMKLPPNEAKIENLKVPVAQQKCPNWAWAAAIELILARQKADFPQSYWVEKASGGDVCVEQPFAIEDLKHLVDGDYVLADGNRVHFDAVVIEGAPTDIGYLVKSMKLGRPLLVFWKDRPLVLESISYDEYIYPNAQRMFEIRTMTLVDPITSKAVTFDKTKDNPADIGGVLDIHLESAIESEREDRPLPTSSTTSPY